MSKVLHEVQSGAVRQRTVLDQDQVVNEWTNFNRDQSLADVAKIRAENSARKMPWGWWSLSIPPDDWQLLITANPELVAKDGPTRQRALRKFMESPISAAYRVRPKSGGATNRVFINGRKT